MRALLSAVSSQRPLWNFGLQRAYQIIYLTKNNPTLFLLCLMAFFLGQCMCKMLKTNCLFLIITSKRNQILLLLIADLLDFTIVLQKCHFGRLTGLYGHCESWLDGSWHWCIIHGGRSNGSECKQRASRGEADWEMSPFFVLVTCSTAPTTLLLSRTYSSTHSGRTEGHNCRHNSAYIVDGCAAFNSLAPKDNGANHVPKSYV